MKSSRVNTIQQVENILNGTDSLEFDALSRDEAYSWIESLLVEFQYVTLSRREKGLLRKYIKHMTGYSRAQAARLIKQYVKNGRVEVKDYERNRFETKYGPNDIKLLALTDDLHQYPSGPSLKTTLGRMTHKFGREKFENISEISTSHIYNLRETPTYKRIAKNYVPTRPSVTNQYGERSKPDPQGKPGYLRVDTVHQGDKDDQKGVYHVNTLDEILQFEVIGAVPKISENYMIPLLEMVLDFYPYRILGFHSDNGSEYINEQIAGLLNRLLIKLTKSRSRKTNDNALVEGKNGSIIRKFMGYLHIEQKWADELNEFYFRVFNNYINYHRPCAFSSEKIDSKGKIEKIYKLENYKTPYDALKQVENAEVYLKDGVTFEMLDEIAYAYDDNEFAELMQRQRRKLFNTIFEPTL